jgi:uncharacterized protein YjbI with pentapeptide repeats
MRNFSNQNLQGRNFRGQDLRGANFTGADIRGAEFVDAQLQGADFSEAKAGLQRRSMIGQIVIAFTLSIVFNFTSTIFNTIVLAYFFSPSMIEDVSIFLDVTLIIFLLSLLLTLTKQGFTTKALSIIIFLFAGVVAGGYIFAFLAAGTFAGIFVVAGAGAFAVAVAGAGVVVGAVAVAFAGAFARAVVGAVAFVVAVAFAGAVASTGAVAFVVASAFVVAVAFVVAGASAGVVGFVAAVVVAVGFVVGFFVAVVGAVAGVVRFAFARAFAVVGAVAFVLALLVGFYGAWRANQGDEKFAILRSFGLAFASLGGTSFSGADLTDANFTNAMLRNTNFANSRKQTTNLMRVCWKDTKKLDKARPGETILANFKVLKLLTTGQGINQDFSNLNLRGANLDHAQLNGANLKYTDLSQACLHQADLQNTNLTELQAIGTDFTGAYLTGACLQSWNIDHANLADIHCDYYFLKEHPNQKANHDRRPHDPERIYEPGDAEKILTETRDILEVLLKQCTSARDLAKALQKLTADYPEATLQKLERKDDADFLVTFFVPPTTDKAQVETTLHKAYDEIRMLRGEVKKLQALRAADRTVNLGTISGNVTNTLNQLATQPQTQAIANHLKQLQTAIETDPNLPELDKADAIEQVGVFAEASQNPTKPETETLTRKAMKLLKGTIEAVPKATSFIEACTKLLPLISKAMGLPF